MTDLDALRNALHETPPQGLTLDTSRILADGKRLRRRRRLLNGSGVVGVAAAVVAVVLGTGLLKAAPQAGNTPVAAPTSSLSVEQESRAPYGEVIPTGIKGPAGELVFYAVRIDDPENLPRTHFGVMAAYRAADGKLKDVMIINETKSTDRRPGFHQLDGGEQIQGQYLPVFGYYAGPAAKITTTAHGKEVQAAVATWSVDPSVRIFWFDPQLVDSDKVLTPPIAFDANGTKLTS